MVLIPQSGRWIAEWAKINKVVVSNNTKGSAVLAVFENGDSLVCGTYFSENQCINALGQLADAIGDHRCIYEFPQAYELPDKKSHYGTGGGRRHGGS